jgi:hypothetical protein
MRDPDRLSSSNGISDFERELLDAGKNESMPSALCEQMERALGLGGAAPAGAPVRARVEAATGVKASAMVWISASVVVLGVVGGIIGSFAGARLGSGLFPPREVAPATAPAPSEQPGAPAIAATSSPAIAAASSSASAGTPAPAPGAIPAAPAAAAALAVAPIVHVSPSPIAPMRRLVAVASLSRSRARIRSAPRHGHDAAPASASSPSTAAAAVAPAEVPTPVASSVSADESTPAAPSRAGRWTPEPSKGSGPPPSGDLRAEIDLIDRARAALRAGDTSEALDLLGRHAVRFSHGALAPEETALRVEALMRGGRTAEARAYARRFIAANPASPLSERLRRLVNAATTAP